MSACSPSDHGQSYRLVAEVELELLRELEAPGPGPGWLYNLASLGIQKI